MKSIFETEQLLKAITIRQTELESLTSAMLSKQYKEVSNYVADKENITEWINVLESISSLNSSISKAI